MKSDSARGFSRAYHVQTKLNEMLEDIAIYAAVLQYCTAQRISGCGDTCDGFHRYVLARPDPPARIYPIQSAVLRVR